MIVDVDALLDDLNMGPLQLERRPVKVKNSRGAYEEQPAAIEVVNPVVWHTTEGRDLELVPEADRNGEVRTFYAKTRFFVNEGQDADVMRCEGRRYRFVKVSDYATAGGVYFGNAVLEDA